MGEGQPDSDTGLRNYEDVLRKGAGPSYFKREGLSHVPDVWMDHDRPTVGYEIGVTRYFCDYTPLRPLADIRADLLALEEEAVDLMREVLAWSEMGQ